MTATLTITSRPDYQVLCTKHDTVVEARRALLSWASERNCQRNGTGSWGILIVEGATVATYTIEV